MDLKETYNKIAEDWHISHQGDGWWVKGADKFSSLLKPGAMILDAGCGGGSMSEYFMKRGFEVFGIDFSEKMIEIAKREVPKGSFMTLDMREVDKLEGTFDAVFMQASLLHIPKKEAESVVRGLVGKLNKDGFLYIAVKETKPGAGEEEVKAEDDYGYKYERFFSYFTLDEIRLIFRSLGLSIVYEDVELFGRARWIEVIGKNE